MKRLMVVSFLAAALLLSYGFYFGKVTPLNAATLSVEEMSKIRGGVDYMDVGYPEKTLRSECTGIASCAITGSVCKHRMDAYGRIYSYKYISHDGPYWFCQSNFEKTCWYGVKYRCGWLAYYDGWSCDGNLISGYSYYQWGCAPGKDGEM